jgi:hypothetical protein
MAIRGLRLNLKSMGFQVSDRCKIGVDNLSTVTTSTKLRSTLKNKMHGVAHHLVREAVAAGIVGIVHVSTNENIADIFTKALDNHTLMKLLARFTIDPELRLNLPHSSPIPGPPG